MCVEENAQGAGHAQTPALCFGTAGDTLQVSWRQTLHAIWRKPLIESEGCRIFLGARHLAVLKIHAQLFMA